MGDIRQELLAAFDAEHREHLAVIRDVLMRIRTGEKPNLVDAFRRAHSLKGAARAVDMEPVEDIAHRAEAVLSRLLDGTLRTGDRAVLEGLERALDAIEATVAALVEGIAPPASAGNVLPVLDALLGGEVPPFDPPVLEAPSGAEPSPGIENEIQAEGTPAAAPVPASEAAHEYLRVSAQQVERLTGAMHGLATDLQNHEVLQDRVGAMVRTVRALQRDWQNLRRTVGKALLEDAQSEGCGDVRSHTTARVRMRTLERDVDSSLAALSRDLDRLMGDQRQQMWSLDQSVRQVRGGVERLSLVSVDSVFSGFAGMVRDLARNAGTEIDFRMAGLDLQIDRRLLQGLKDPVMHLLRNAVAHGVETAEQRAALGKPEQRSLALRFDIEGARLVVTVRDDGKGIDFARIATIAAEKGLVDKASDLASRREHLIALLFSAGFSTAETVDRLSGRGMGLSVVQEAVRQLRGTVELRPELPWGTLATLSVPLSSARHPLVVVEAGGQNYCLPSHAVKRLLRVPVGEIGAQGGQPVLTVDIRGETITVPVVGLDNLLNGSMADIAVTDGHLSAVLVRAGSYRCALAVDGLLDVRTMLVGETKVVVGSHAAVTGTVFLEEDRLALVLDPVTLVEQWMRSEAGRSGIGLATWRTTAARTQPTILVVDDSITTRTLERSILEAQGFRVLVSVDGLDALTMLRDGGAVIDLVVADIEMPRMDGFALLQAMKNDPQLASIPVVLMTSRADPADVRRGLDLGAGAYVTKQKFDQRELLATINQLL